MRRNVVVVLVVWFVHASDTMGLEGADSSATIVVSGDDNGTSEAALPPFDPLCRRHQYHPKMAMTEVIDPNRPDQTVSMYVYTINPGADSTKVVAVGCVPSSSSGAVDGMPPLKR